MPRLDIYDSFDIMATGINERTVFTDESVKEQPFGLFFYF